MILAIILAMTVGAAPPQFVQRPCQGDALASNGARCGTVSVAENRAMSGGRKVALNVIVLPSTSAERSLPPLYDIEGGPGNASTNSAAFYLGDGAAYRRRRDVVLVDQRGTGGSNRLDCPVLAAADRSYAPIYPIAEVVKCRDALSKHADLRFYGTREAVVDLDDVRVALGHQRIDLVGISYGTTFVLRYLAAHPTSVRAAILVAPVPASARPPRSHAAVAEVALARLFAQCRADVACRTAFDPVADFDQAMARLSTMKGAPSREVFLEKLRTLMYRPVAARGIPRILYRAAQGDLAPFFAATRASGGEGIAEGLYLSITCGESLALTDIAKARREARRTRFGDYRLRRQQLACRSWPKVQVADDHLVPVRATAAVLLLAGTEDPVASPEWATSLARGLPRSRLLIAPGGGHGLEGVDGLAECFDGFAIAFLEHGDPARVDASCLAKLILSRFALPEPAKAP